MSYLQVTKDTQRSGRKAASQKSKNPAGKRRERGNPYASWTDPTSGWYFELLKSYQSDNNQPYARWFMWVQGDFAEFGDEYVKNIRASLYHSLAMGVFSEGGTSNGYVRFDGTVWNSGQEFIKWARGNS